MEDYNNYIPCPGSVTCEFVIKMSKREWDENVYSKPETKDVLRDYPKDYRFNPRDDL